MGVGVWVCVRVFGDWGAWFVHIARVCSCVFTIRRTASEAHPSTSWCWKTPWYDIHIGTFHCPQFEFSMLTSIIPAWSTIVTRRVSQVATTTRWQHTRMRTVVGLGAAPQRDSAHVLVLQAATPRHVRRYNARTCCAPHPRTGRPLNNHSRFTTNGLLDQLLS